ncbi:MAG: desulfoferrodoxin family protein [Bacteroidales bacterium]|nr:desulfoferrodoxin family protein [Bacteroidales bacterium]
MKAKFYRCDHCGNIITHLYKSPANVVCCGEPMKELMPNTSDGAGEKHVPVIEMNGNTVTVKVGSVEHPMLENHYIQWIALETETGLQIKYLKPGEKPVCTFAVVSDDKVLAAYEYCNLHGLWMAEAK